MPDQRVPLAAGVEPGVPAARRRVPALVALGVALAAGTALVVAGPGRGERVEPAQRVTAAVAWPGVQRADLPGGVSDGPLLQPLLFLDARTVIGTAPSPDGADVRLVVLGTELRELRRRPVAGAPEFRAAAVAGDDLVWAESAGDGPTEIWTANRTSGAARRVTADTGDFVAIGSEHDLVLTGGRVFWAATAGPAATGETGETGATGATGGTDRTQIRSVALSGGVVQVREEPGRWALSAWPWIVEGGPDNVAAPRLRSLTGNLETRVPVTGGLSTCSPAWCRVSVLSGGGLERIDVMRPDGKDRRQVAGAGAGTPVADVAVLDRYLVLGEATPGSDPTGGQGLLVYDLTTNRTIDVDPAATGVGAGNGLLWWSTGDQDHLAWHTVDLRTA